MFRNLLNKLIILIALSNFLLAQKYAETPYQIRDYFGIYGGLNYNMHTANLKGLPGIPSCCPRYETGMGVGINLGLYYSLPLAETFEFTFKTQYTMLGAKLSKEEPVLIAKPDGSGGSWQTFEHTLDASISSISIIPQVNMRLGDQLKASAGLRIGFLMEKSFNQKEVLLSSWGYFPETGTRTRHDTSGDIPDANSVELALVTGLSYDLPISQSFEWFLVPEVNYTIGITNIAAVDKWTINTFGSSIGIKYAPRQIIPPKPPPLPPPPPPLPPPPPPPEVPLLDATIIAVSLEKDSTESPVSKMIIEEFGSTRLQPFLKYIFFDENSSAIPINYKKMSTEEKARFKNDDKVLYNLSTMNVYYQILNIVGKRMLKNPNAVLTLTGCNSDAGVEKGNTGLSARRAERVKSFLISEWSIEPGRLNVKSKNLPDLPSNTTDPDGEHENMRVEMDANYPDIFEPIKIEELVIKSNPPVIRFKSKVNSEIGISSWEIVTSQTGGDLKIFEGEGQVAPNVDWDIEKEEEFIPKFDEPLKYKLEITDNDNKVWESPAQELPIEQITKKRKMEDLTLADKEISRFSFISFPFNSAELTKEHKHIISIAKSVLQKNSIVRIEGYTDRTGDTELNLTLSQRRAENIARALGLSPSQAKGLGEVMLYDNDLPEGRFFNRTVNIVIETPIESR
ncbi:MAG: OmpA family protein [Ignavibacteriae bacterium]|nr:OmpA family protein [Ignavibacteriota bacterium]